MIDRQIFGRQLIEIDEVDSTNLRAQELLKNQKVVEGAVITTNFQTNGRGQIGTSWFAEKAQNLLFSLVLFPSKLPLEKQFYLSKVIAIGIVTFIKELGIPCAKIKWPNDIYVGSKKICGVLIENNLRGYRLESSIVGIGLNVNQEDFGIFGESASSLKLLLGQHFDRKVLLTNLLEKLEVWFNLLIEESYTQIDLVYHQNLLYSGKWAEFEINNSRVLRKVVHVNPQGLLCLESKAGEIETYGMKELKFII